VIIDFTCQKCDASFDLDVQDLIDGTERLACPHCDAKAPAKLATSFVAALTELRAQIATLEPKFLVSVTLESPALADLGDDDDDDDLDDEDVDDDDKH
jgi:DNA-directed RNA polymerase subunit RPC12/RpoP